MFQLQPQKITLQVDLRSLYPFVEKGTELSKQDLIHRTAGKVDYPILQKLKLLEFCRIGKSESGSLYLL
jgi:hypothetical protein